MDYVTTKPLTDHPNDWNGRVSILSSRSLLRTLARNVDSIVAVNKIELTKATEDELRSTNDN